MEKSGEGSYRSSNTPQRFPSSCSLFPIGKRAPLMVLLLLPCSLLTLALHPDTHTKGKSRCWEPVGCFLSKQPCEDVDLETKLQQPGISCWQ